MELQNNILIRIKHILKPYYLPYLHRFKKWRNIKDLNLNGIKKQKLFKEALEDMKNILDKKGINFFLFCGTALGAYREKAFIEHDPDIDVGVLDDEFNKTKNLKDNRFTIAAVYPLSGPITEVAYRHKNGVKIDIFQAFKTPEGLEHYSYMGPCNDKPNKRCTFVNDFNFEEIEFLGKSYTVPGKEFLDSHYGKDWHIVKKFGYSDGLVNGDYKSLR